MAKPAIRGFSVRRSRGCAGKSSAPWAVVEMASQRATAGFAWLCCCCGQSEATLSSTGHLGAGRGSSTCLSAWHFACGQPGLCCGVELGTMAALTLFRQVCFALSATHFNI